MTKLRIVSLVCLTGVALQAFGAEAPVIAPNPVTATTDRPAVTAEELQQLRERIAKQEEEIQKLQQSVEEQRSLLNGLQSATTTAPVVNAPSAPESGPAQLIPVAAISRPARVLPAGRGGQKTETPTSPLGISIGNTTFTPLGFIDFTYYARSTNVGTGLGTTFAGIPYNNGVTGRISENNLSTQNSRIGFRVDSKFMGAKVLGYFEADFYGNQPGGVFVTSNSNTFRMRNVFLDIQKNGLEVLGGQDWSMFTPNRKGLSPIPGDIFFSQNIDLNYQSGLVWARQSQFRLIAHPNDDFAFGISIENPQQYTSTFVTFPTTLAASQSTEFNSGGTSYAAPNSHPDIIFKAAYDGHVGDSQILHVEAGALIRGFKNVLPASTTTALSYKSNYITEAAGEIDANLEVVKNFKIIANTFFGAGNGRYIGTGIGPDVIVHADGTLSPVHSYSTVDGFEANVTKNTLLSAYYGGSYFSRNVAFDTNGTTPIGYGFFKSNNNRNVQEATINLNRTIWKNPTYGAVNLMAQYSYLWRDPWSSAGVAGNRNARTNMYYLNLRYTLP